MLKWILVAIALVFVGGCTLVVGGVAWFISSAKAPPEFYEAVEPVQLTKEERTVELEKMRALALRVAPSLAAAEDAGMISEDTPIGESSTDGVERVDEFMEAEERDAELPSENANDQISAESGTEEMTAERAPQLDGETPAVEMVSYPLAMSEKELNAFIRTLFTEYGGQITRVLSDPRIKLSDGKAKIGVRFTTPEISGVVGIEVEPRVENAKSIALFVHNIALGKIEIPVQQALVSAEIDPEELPEGIQILDDVSPPTVLLSWDHLENVLTEVDSAMISDGAIELNLLIPKPDDEAGEEPDEGSTVDEPSEGKPDLSRTRIPRRIGKPATLPSRVGMSVRPEFVLSA